VFLQFLIFVGSLVAFRWNQLLFSRKCCFLNGFWCVFVVMIFLVWSLAFFHWSYCFFYRESGVFAIIFLFGSLVVFRWNLLLFYRKGGFLNGFWCVLL